MSHHLQLSPELEANLSRMYEEEQEVIRTTDDHWVRPRSLHPDSAAFLSMLARTAGAKRILEIGTSVGFSTIYLADAMRQAGGRITTVELLPEKSEKARQNIQAAGLSEYVAQRTGDVRELAGQLTGPWDMVFIDTEKELYLPIFNILSNEVRVGGLLLADNVISHAEDLKDYLSIISADRRYETVTIPLGQGIELSRRIR
jgi:predicted O-methyltransferase YrrM